jgi:biotin synthase
MKISLSYASLVKLGLSKGEIDFPLSTIYVMIGERCRNRCKFCSQSAESKNNSNKFLSRITWKEVSLDNFISTLNQHRAEIKRICLQVVAEVNFEKKLLPIIKALLCKEPDYKVSVSIASTNYEFLKNLFDTGIDVVTIPLDCAKKETYERIKGFDFYERLETLFKLSKAYPFKVNTHLIYGLSDTEKDFYELMNLLKSNSISTGLFSFTPLKGTKLEALSPPPLKSYRRVQILRALIYSNIPSKAKFNEDEKLSELYIYDKDSFERLLKNGTPFLTSGCENCTRPYYNDSPLSKELYNYHRSLSRKEIDNCINEALAEVQVIYL